MPQVLNPRDVRARVSSFIAQEEARHKRRQHHRQEQQRLAEEGGDRSGEMEVDQAQARPRPKTCAEHKPSPRLYFTASALKAAATPMSRDPPGSATLAGLGFGGLCAQSACLWRLDREEFAANMKTARGNVISLFIGLDGEARSGHSEDVDVDGEAVGRDSTVLLFCCCCFCARARERESVCVCVCVCV